MKKIGYYLGAGLLAVSLSSLSASAVKAQDKVELSANAALTSDYVWRGYSQSSEHYAGQVGADASYNIFYAGVWGSSIDFDTPKPDFEVDVYAGIKPKFGNVEFDLGVIYYMYPSAEDDGAELNFVEMKAGASTSFDKLSFGATVFYSPETTGKGGKTWTYEATAEYSLPMDFALSGTIGRYAYKESDADYTYWNVGVSKSFSEHWTVDARYWDTNVKDTPIAESRFVGTISVSF